MKPETKSRLLNYLTVVANVIYKLLILAALLWIGYGIQGIDMALNTPVEDGADQSSAGPDPQDNQPQIIKPLLRGRM